MTQLWLIESTVLAVNEAIDLPALSSSLLSDLQLKTLSHCLRQKLQKLEQVG